MIKNPEYYAGHWVALSENQQVAGVGTTPRLAEQVARMRWPKEHLHIVFIAKSPPYLALPEWPLQFLRDHIPPALAGKVWLVGGPVRDLLQDKPVHDWDFVVDGDALRLARDIANSLNGAFYPLDTERGTARVIVTEADGYPSCVLDFAQIRGNTLEADLHARDFTLNAMAATLDGEVIDMLEGISDLENRCLRQVSDHSFRDDPARLLRAIRQSCQYQLTIEPTTLAQLRQDAPLVAEVSPERIFAELNRLIETQASPYGMQQLLELGLLKAILPELDSLTAVEQGYPHVYSSAWQHTLAVLAAMDRIVDALLGHTTERRNTQPNFLRDHLPDDQRIAEMLASFNAYLPQLRQYLSHQLNAGITVVHALKWATLFHDLGKAGTRSVDQQGKVHFYQHDKRSAQLSQQRLVALHVPNNSSHFIVSLVQEHMRFLNFDQSAGMTRRMVHRYFRATGDTGVALALLTLADTLGVRGNQLRHAQWQRRLAQAEAVMRGWFDHQDDLVAPQPLLNGNDLIEAGLDPGPEMGRILNALLEAQAAQLIQDKAQALTWLDQYRSDH